MLTHFERFYEPMEKHIPLVKKVFDDFMISDYADEKTKETKPFKDAMGFWFYVLFVKRKGVWTCKNGEVINLYKDVSEKEAHERLQIFAALIYSHWFKSSAVDNEISMINETHTNINLTIHQSHLQKMTGRDNASTTLECHYQICAHDISGRKVYDVSPGLSDKLRNTELRGLKAEDVRLPYHNIYITVPRNTGFQIYNDHTGWHELEGIYITQDKRSRKEPVSYVRADFEKNEIKCDDGIKFEDRPVIREWGMMFCGGPSKDANGNPIPDDDSLYFFRMYFPDGDTIDQCMDEVEERYGMLQNNVGPVKKDIYIATIMRDMWRKIFKWTMNVVTYATYTDPGEEFIKDPEARKLWAKINACPEGSRTRRNLEKKSENINPHRRIILGKNILVDRNQPQNESGAKGTGRSLTVRVLVCGHWRNVACGKGRLERRYKFIEPFWRGPDAASTAKVSSKRHLLRDKSDRISIS